MSGAWRDHPGSATDHRPASQRFTHPKLAAFTIAASPITTPDLSRFDGDYGSIPVRFTVDAETFNREVGWVVSGWHWSVVRMGAVIGAGDELTIDAARKAAEDCTRQALGRKRSAIDAVWPSNCRCSGCRYCVAESGRCCCESVTVCQ